MQLFDINNTVSSIKGKHVHFTLKFSMECHANSAKQYMLNTY